MRRHRVHRILTGLAAVGGFLAALWFGYGWLTAPGTDRGAIIYLSIAAVSAVLNVIALRRFHRMTVIIRAAEAAGRAEPGSTLFAENQRFRYAARVVESVLIGAVGGLAIAGNHYPHLQVLQVVGWVVLVYFVGQPALTGYLTKRDLDVVDTVSGLGSGDAAELRSFTEEQPRGPV